MAEDKQKVPTIKLYNSEGESIDGVVDCFITDYSTAYEEWLQGVSKDGSEMKKLEWTREVPVEEGFYWKREEDGWCEIVRVSIFAAGPSTYFHTTSSGHLRMDVHGVNMEWYGPITPPK